MPQETSGGVPEPEETTDTEAEDEDVIAGRFDTEVQKNCTTFKYLHHPGSPVFVVHVHDLLTACIAAEQPEVQGLCVDLPTLCHLVGRREARKQDFLTNVTFNLTMQVATIAQRNGKLLSVDMRT